MSSCHPWRLLELQVRMVVSAQAPTRRQAVRKHPAMLLLSSCPVAVMACIKPTGWLGQGIGAPPSLPHWRAMGKQKCYCQGTHAGTHCFPLLFLCVVVAAAGGAAAVVILSTRAQLASACPCPNEASSQLHFQMGTLLFFDRKDDWPLEWQGMRCPVMRCMKGVAAFPAALRVRGSQPSRNATSGCQGGARLGVILPPFPIFAPGVFVPLASPSGIPLLHPIYCIFRTLKASIFPGTVIFEKKLAMTFTLCKMSNFKWGLGIS